MTMEYRRLGKTGLKVSVLSFGSWVTFGPQLSGSLAEDCLAAAYDAGVNFFDNAEAYSAGESERIMGEAIASLGWPRHSYVLSTKLFWGTHPGVNMRNTLNRKYLLQAIDGSLERFGLDFVDLVYCHRPDPETPRRGDGVGAVGHHRQGKALYWGTSEWSAEAAARGVGHRRSPQPPQAGGGATPVQPVVEGPGREGVRPALRRHRPRADHLEPAELRPPDRQVSRRGAGRVAATLPGYEWLRNLLTDPERNEKVRSSESIAEELDCTLAQLAIAWCAKNPHVSSVITGASRVEQVHENLAALDVLPKLTDDVMARIDKLALLTRPPALRAPPEPAGRRGWWRRRRRIWRGPAIPKGDSLEVGRLRGRAG